MFETLLSSHPPPPNTSQFLLCSSPRAYCVFLLFLLPLLQFSSCRTSLAKDHWWPPHFRIPESLLHSHAPTSLTLLITLSCSNPSMTWASVILFSPGFPLSSSSYMFETFISCPLQDYPLSSSLTSSTAYLTFPCLNCPPIAIWTWTWTWPRQPPSISFHLNLLSAYVYHMATTSFFIPSSVCLWPSLRFRHGTIQRSSYVTMPFLLGCPICLKPVFSTMYRMPPLSPPSNPTLRGIFLQLCLARWNWTEHASSLFPD